MTKEEYLLELERLKNNYVNTHVINYRDALLSGVDEEIITKRQVMYVEHSILTNWIRNGVVDHDVTADDIFVTEELRAITTPVRNVFLEFQNIRSPMMLLFDTEGFDPTLNDGLGGKFSRLIGNKTISVEIVTQTEPLIIDWGDGQIETVYSSVTHTYANPGRYIVRLDGTIRRFPHNTSTNQHRWTLVDVIRWGNTCEIKNYASAFISRFSLTQLTAMDSPDFKGVTDASDMFNTCINFTGGVGHWDMGDLESFSRFFLDCRSFNENLNSWNTSKFLNLRQMFSGARSYNQPLNNWDVSNVTNMSNMFSNTNAFNQPLNNWDVSNVTDMSNMFSNTNAFNQPLNNWDVSNVTNMSTMFWRASAFRQDISNWVLRRNVAIGSFMGEDLTTMSSYITPDWKNNFPRKPLDVLFKPTSSTFTLIFHYDGTPWQSGRRHGDDGFCFLFDDDTLISIIRVRGGNSHITNATIPNFNPSKTYRLQWFGGYFRFSSDQPTNDIRNFITEVVDFGDTFMHPFQYALKLTDSLNTTDPNTSPANPVLPANIKFKGDCSGFLENRRFFNSPVNHWDMTEATSLNYFFRGCRAFNQPLTDWTLPNVNTLHGFLYNARSFNQRIDHLITENITDISSLLYNAINYNQTMVNADTRNITNMSYTFWSCVSYVGSGLANWNTSKVTNMSNIFSGCRSYSGSPVDARLTNWDVSNVVSGQQMFGRSRDVPRFVFSDSTWSSRNCSYNRTVAHWNVNNVVMGSTTTQINDFKSNWAPSMSNLNKPPRFR